MKNSRKKIVRVTQEHINGIKTLADAGISMQKISEVLNIGRSTVDQIKATGFNLESYTEYQAKAKAKHEAKKLGIQPVPEITGGTLVTPTEEINLSIIETHQLEVLLGRLNNLMTINNDKLDELLTVFRAQNDRKGLFGR